MQNQKGTASEISVRADKLKEEPLDQLQKDTVNAFKRSHDFLKRQIKKP
jgi:hypothetical protein